MEIHVIVTKKCVCLIEKGNRNSRDVTIPQKRSGIAQQIGTTASIVCIPIITFSSILHDDYNTAIGHLKQSNPIPNSRLLTVKDNVITVIPK